ncbi:MAG: exopolysaccharide biosynthesis protein, partial [Gammaproteobacteria bacterium]|nr:exopolysaccharide biosynthesis protein [Gammaproteobacteria bacterium]
ALPIPFANLGPALVIIIMALGLLERDGVIQVFAASIGCLLMGAIYILVSNNLGTQ